MEMTKLPLFFRKYCALMPTIRAWSGCATSADTHRRLDHASYSLLYMKTGIIRLQSSLQRYTTRLQHAFSDESSLLER